MADDQPNDVKGLTAAPYCAFSSVKTAIKQMKEHGVPGRIDRSVLTNLSGAVVTQVMTAFRFLRLIDSEGAPSRALHDAVDAVDDEGKWPAALEFVIRAAYAPLLASDLEKASPSQFNEHFRRNYPGAEDVQRKSITFFLNAAREANIPISKYIMKNKKPRSAPTKRRQNKPSKPNSAGAANGGIADNPPPPPRVTPEAEKPMEYRLLDMIDAGMTDPEKAAVWTLISYLKKQQKGAA